MTFTMNHTKNTKNQLDTKKLRALRVLRGEYLSSFRIAALIYSL